MHAAPPILPPRRDAASRRSIVSAAGACALLAASRALGQALPARARRVGFLGTAAQGEMASRVAALRDGLRELGWIEGRDLVVDYRWADGDAARLEPLAAELAGAGAEVIVTHSLGVVAARKATSSVPIVIAAGGDPIASGVTTSLAKPSANVTGIVFFAEELAAKRVELLAQAIPKLKSVAILRTPIANAALVGAVAASGRALNLETPEFDVRAAQDFPKAFAAMARHRVGAACLPDIPLLTAYPAELARVALESRMPAAGTPQFADAGGLLGYGVGLDDQFRRAAVFVDRLLKGAKPADLPIERPTSFEFVVNLKTARTLGVAIPQAVLLRANRVVD